MMTIDLLPCPFCGGAALFGACGHAEDDDNAGAEYISCTKCDATTALVYPCMDEVKALLAERWNRRFTTAAASASAGVPARASQGRVKRSSSAPSEVMLSLPQKCQICKGFIENCTGDDCDGTGEFQAHLVGAPVTPLPLDSAGGAPSATAPLPPKQGDYVLATKYSDGDPGDPWAIGFYAGIDLIVPSSPRHMVNDGAGKTIRHNGYRRVGRITPEIGNWLFSNRDLLERAPSKINLWSMYDWTFVNEKVVELSPAAAPQGGDTGAPTPETRF